MEYLVFQHKDPVFTLKKQIYAVAIDGIDLTLGRQSKRSVR